MALTGVSMINQNNALLVIIPIAVYPFLTIQRRVECQSHKSKLMLKPKYTHFFNALRTIYREEGLRAMYKGFPAFAIATAIWMFTVPSLAQWYMVKSPWSNQDQRDITFKGDQDPMQAYQEEADDIYDEDIRAAQNSERAD